MGESAIFIDSTFVLVFDPISPFPRFYCFEALTSSWGTRKDPIRGLLTGFSGFMYSLCWKLSSNSVSLIVVIGWSSPC
jgi:hypothetical protein